jgi:hypothetical protein
VEDDRIPSSDPDEQIVRLLKASHEYILALPPDERRIAALAAGGAAVWEIAQQMRISDEAVARVIDRVVAALSGREVEPVETGGLGADTDPGVSGGYDPDPFGTD